ncbi:MAG TPA: hypothetical protein VLA48_06095 [Nitrososphaeraceae archaeon]|jgi:hypothetical protein|nr:hypothetical protein [Nitrososphaeraceae archaeon]
MSSAANDNDNSTFLHHTFTKNILNSNKSIRWVGMIDQNGITLNERYREGLKPFLTVEENHEFAKDSITRYKTRLKLESKIGKLTYLFRRYEKLSRCVIPINENYYLLLAMDFQENNFDKIIMEKIIPLIKKKRDFL